MIELKFGDWVKTPKVEYREEYKSEGPRPISWFMLHCRVIRSEGDLVAIDCDGGILWRSRKSVFAEGERIETILGMEFPNHYDVARLIDED